MYKNIKTGNRPRYDTNRENNYKQQITTTTTTGQMYDMTRILFHTTTTTRRTRTTTWAQSKYTFCGGTTHRNYTNFSNTQILVNIHLTAIQTFILRKRSLFKWYKQQQQQKTLPTTVIYYLLSEAYCKLALTNNNIQQWLAVLSVSS